SDGSDGSRLSLSTGESRVSELTHRSRRSHGSGVAGGTWQTGRAADTAGVTRRACERREGGGAVGSWLSGRTGISGEAGLSRRSRRARRAPRLDRLALAPARVQSGELSLLSEDRVEWVLSRLGGRRHEHLYVHHLGPRGVRLGTKDRHSVHDIVVDIGHLLVESGNNDETGNHGQCRGSRGHAHQQLLLEH
ncbi:hypothetical protein PFISCL1PPCAC_13498, partial [Pristionchus fissidentatus]